ncbi:MAG: HlyD family efflux transporter periplasmic adaptor subunit, partial [Acidimicrobiaceae bacterium]|nr:HlyD family efflux transporter periplasmic adaptor subunit [Acidimicrobiaceae bacterium]
QAYEIDVTPAEASNLVILEKAQRDAAERLRLDLLRTDVEADLVLLGIITDVQAYEIDVTPAEASNLVILEKAQRDAAERLRLDLYKTDVEADLVRRGIITDTQAYKIDVTPAEASNLITLEQAERVAINGFAMGSVTYAEHAAAVQAYADALEAAVANVSVVAHAAAVQAYADGLEAAVADESVAEHAVAVQAYGDALEAAVEESAEMTAATDALEDLRDEQQRLEYRLAAARETLRVAQAGRYVLSDANEVTVSIDDPDVPDVPILVLRADSETVSESGMAMFTIETTVELVDDLDVFYVLEGTATPDVDFNAPDGDVTMGKGQERVTLSIPIRADDDVEADESVTVRLIVEPSGAYRLSDRDRATIQIKSADLPELTVAGGGEVTEGGTVIVTIQADQPPDKDTSVNYSVSGSAQAGIDYEVVTGTALLPAGQLSVDIPIRTILDDVFFMPGDMVVADWPARVGSVEVEEGDLVQRATPLFNLTDPGFTITLFASPTDRSKLVEGQEVTVNLASGDQEVEGIITHLDDTATTSGGSETYEGVVDTAESLVGVDGAVVTIDVVVEQSLDAVVVPIAAVLSDGGQETVRVVTPDGIIERRAIETGMLDGAYVEVVTGVAPGEYVILEIDRS